MATLVEVARSALRLPDGCVECDGAASRTYALWTAPRTAPLVVPLCERHGELKILGQVAWAVAWLVVAVGVVVLGAVVAETVLSRDTAHTLVVPIVLALLGLGGVIVWRALRRGRARFHRRFSAVWIEATAPERVVLGFRAAALARRVEALSGLAPPPADPYREAPPALERDHDGRPAFVSPSSLVLLVGLAIVLVGIAEYVSIGRAERRGGIISGHSLEIITYRLFGRAGVLALFGIPGTLLFAIGAVGLARRLRRPARSIAVPPDRA